jgi:nitronate monooxygenase
MALRTALTRRLSIDLPIVQAPMAGGSDTPELVAAVSGAGGIGFMGAAYLSPEQIAAFADAVRHRSRRPFGINLFAPTPVPPRPTQQAAACDAINAYHLELELEPPGLPDSLMLSFDEQVVAALECSPAAISFVFEIPAAEVLDSIKARNILLLGTATTVEEAMAWERAGADMVIAQGSEAGGHRSSFGAPFEVAMIGTMALVPQIVDAVSVPVLAAGGIMDGRGLAAALALGAAGVQMGTAFLTCDESGASEAYRRAVLTAREQDTRVTRAFSGRPARGIVNRMMGEVEELPDAILPFPWQNALTRPLRAAAAKNNREEFLSLWAGQGLRMAQRQSAGQCVLRIAAEAKAILAALGGG